MLRRTPPSQLNAENFSITLAIVESETLVCEGLLALFRDVGDFTCILSAAECVEAVRQAEFRRPDVTLLDPRAAFDRKYFGLKLWRERLPETRLVVFDHSVRDVHLRDVLRFSGVGYATRGDSFDQLTEVLRCSARGEPAFSPKARQRLCETPQGIKLDVSADRPGLHRLTARELEILVYLAQGYSGRQCSEQLGISSSTVENHRTRILHKLEVRKTVDLTRIAIREGLMPR